MKSAPIIERAGPLPRTVDGTALDHNCLHCQLALPIQHFMDRHPEMHRVDIIKQMCESVAELIGSSTDSPHEAARLTRMAQEEILEQADRKFKAYARLRAAAAEKSGN